MNDEKMLCLGSKCIEMEYPIRKKMSFQIKLLF